MAGELPRLLPFPPQRAGSGHVPWRCDDYLVPPSDAGVGCVVRALCSLMAVSVDTLELWRDKALGLQGGVGGEITFGVLQAALKRLVSTTAPAGAIVLRKVDSAPSAWRVLELEDGVFLWGSWLRRANGTLLTHAIGYNAETKLLYLGMATLALTNYDLSDVPAFVEWLDCEYGVFVDDEPDLRRIYIVAAHAGARRLPIYPPHALDHRPTDPCPKHKRCRKR